MADRFGGMGNGPSTAGEDGTVTPGLKRVIMIGGGALVGLFVLYMLVAGMGGGAGSQNSEVSPAEWQRRSEARTKELADCEERGSKLRKSLAKCERSSSGSGSSSGSSSRQGDSSELESLKKERDFLKGQVESLKKQLSGAGSAMGASSAGASKSCSDLEDKVLKLQEKNSDLEKKLDSLRAAQGSSSSSSSSSSSGSEASSSSTCKDDLEAMTKKFDVCRVELEKANEAKSETTTDASSETSSPSKEKFASLDACIKKTQTLGEEIRSLDLKLAEAEKIKFELNKVKKDVMSQSKKLDRDTVKVMQVEDKAGSTVVKDELQGIHKDMVKRSMSMEKSAKKIEAVEKAVDEKVTEARDKAVKIEKDIAQPIKSLEKETEKFEEKKAEAKEAEKKAEKEIDETLVPKKDIRKQVADLSQAKADLVSNDKLKAVKAAEKVEAIAEEIKDKAEEVEEKKELVKEKNAAADMRAKLAKEEGKVVEREKKSLEKGKRKLVKDRLEVAMKKSKVQAAVSGLEEKKEGSRASKFASLRKEKEKMDTRVVGEEDSNRFNNF